jgi:hypothetical protein
MGNPKTESLGFETEDLKKQHEIEEGIRLIEKRKQERDAAWQELWDARAANDAERALKANELWMEFEKQYKHDLDEVINGYDTLVAVLNKMVASIIKFAKYMRKEHPIEWYVGFVFNKIVDNVIVGSAESLKEMYLRNKKEAEGYEQFETPEFYFKLKMDANQNAIDPDEIVLGNQKENVTAQQKKQFEYATEAWLANYSDTPGVIYKLENKVVNNKVYWEVFKLDPGAVPGAAPSKVKINSAEFQKMLSDPQKGLPNYFDKKYGLKLKEMLLPEPKPRMNGPGRP